MAELKAGDKVRYKKDVYGSYRDWSGLEGVVDHVSVTGTAYVRVTKKSAQGMGRVGQMSSLNADNLEKIVETVEAERDIRVGNLVRVVHTSHWAGMEGVVIADHGPESYRKLRDRYEIRITKQGGCWKGVGGIGYVNGNKLEVLKKVAEPAEPKLKAGDKVRVNDKVRSKQWVGAVCEVVTVRESGMVNMKAVSDLPRGYRAGDPVNFEIEKLDLIGADSVIETGDTVRVNENTCAPTLVGVEGVVKSVKHDRVSSRVTKTKPGNFIGVGEDLTLDARKFDLVKKADGTVVGDFVVGERVRVENYSPGLDVWEGWEGTVSRVDKVWIEVKFEGKQFSAGGFERKHLVRVADGEQLPRSVDVSDIRVGDKIRVTYAEKKTVHGDVIETELGLVREGVVAYENGWGRFDSMAGYRINPAYDGRTATYELLARPEKKVEPPVLTAAEAAVGAQAMTEEGGLGKRLLTKIGEDKWSEVFLKTGNSYPATDREAQEVLDGRGGEWLKVA